MSNNNRQLGEAPWLHVIISTDFGIGFTPIAKELDITLVITSSLNCHHSEEYGDEIYFPKLDDLAAIGDLNEYSDIVIGMGRAEICGVDMDECGYKINGTVQLKVLKSYRNDLKKKDCSLVRTCFLSDIARAFDKIII